MHRWELVNDTGNLQPQLASSMHSTLYELNIWSNKHAWKERFIGCFENENEGCDVSCRWSNEIRYCNYEGLLEKKTWDYEVFFVESALAIKVVHTLTP